MGEKITSKNIESELANREEEIQESFDRLSVDFDLALGLLGDQDHLARALVEGGNLGDESKFNEMMRTIDERIPKVQKMIDRLKELQSRLAHIKEKRKPKTT